MPDLLLEIGSEEIPAGFMLPALAAMAEEARKMLARQHLKHGEITTTGTPRRLVLVVRDVASRQETFCREVIGPAKGAAFDEEGKPTKAATGFARGHGVEISNVFIKETPRGEYVFAKKMEGGKPAMDVLSVILPELISSIPFPKSMRWGDGDVRFARPIHWILALFDREIVNFHFADVQSGDRSRGHRFMDPASFSVTGVEDYFRKVEEGMVIVDYQKRRRIIAEGLLAEAKANDGHLLEDPDLLETVNFLVEYPTVTCGSYDEEYLALPPEVLITSMKSHQKYFPVVNEEGGLKPLFLTVSNTRARDMEVVRRGNERVLLARLADAKFFYNEDRKKNLEAWVEELKRVVYHEKLGTSFEKLERFRAVALHLCREYGLGSPEIVGRAALLCKADLVSEMVGEFPDLQGIMGKYYAMEADEPEAVARAIYEHYFPRFAGDALPETLEGAVISIADKIDTIVGSFGIGQKPTGSEDPYGLRRLTIGIINIIINKGLEVDLANLVKHAIEELEGKKELSDDQISEDVMEFFRGRLLNMFAAEGYRYDVVEAVLASGITNLVDVHKRLEAINTFASTDDFEPLAVAFKRVVNIIPEGFEGKVKENLLKEESEVKLFNIFNNKEKGIGDLKTKRDYRQVLIELASIRPAVDEFFDKVMVMVDDRALRNNRLALMLSLATLFVEVADFAKMAV